MVSFLALVAEDMLSRRKCKKLTSAEARKANPDKVAGGQQAPTSSNVDAPEDADSDKDEDAPVFSLATGTYKSRRLFGAATEEDKRVDPSAETAEAVQALTIRNNEYTLAKLESAGSHYLSSRHFQGLQVREGMDAPAVLEEGRGGIARGYTEEK
jgi:diphthamide biosynthesis protein 2